MQIICKRTAGRLSLLAALQVIVFYKASIEKELKTFYPSTMGSVDRMEMLQAGGERKIIHEPEQIAAWLNQLGDLNVVINPDPVDSSGSLFVVTLFHGENHIFQLSPTSINGTAILPNDNIADRMSEIWDGG